MRAKVLSAHREARFLAPDTGAEGIDRRRDTLIERIRVVLKVEMDGRLVNAILELCAQEEVLLDNARVEEGEAPLDAMQPRDVLVLGQILDLSPLIEVPPGEYLAQSLVVGPEAAELALRADRAAVEAIWQQSTNRTYTARRNT